MICRACDGLVLWQGPLAALTHTQCVQCGAVNTEKLEDHASPSQETKPQPDRTIWQKNEKIMAITTSHLTSIGVDPLLVDGCPTSSYRAAAKSGYIHPYHPGCIREIATTTTSLGEVLDLLVRDCTDGMHGDVLIDASGIRYIGVPPRRHALMACVRSLGLSEPLGEWTRIYGLCVEQALGRHVAGTMEIMDIAERQISVAVCNSLNLPRPDCQHLTTPTMRSINKGKQL